MPRCGRIFSETKIYHVMLRGNNKEKIFQNRADKNTIINIISNKKEDGEFLLFAYCVMDNHIHLVIREGVDDLSTSIKKIASSYAYYYNKRYNRVGHVFQDRFKSENVEDDRYLLSVIRYVHQNPVKAGIGTIEGYQWSSYRQYFTGIERVVDCDIVLELFSDNKERARYQFREFSKKPGAQVFLDIEEYRPVDNNNVEDFINEYLNKNSITKEQLQQNEFREIKGDLIKLLLKQSSLSKRKIAEVTGINREMVRTMALSMEPSP